MLGVVALSQAPYSSLGDELYILEGAAAVAADATVSATAIGLFAGQAAPAATSTFSSTAVLSAGGQANITALSPLTIDATRVQASGALAMGDSGVLSIGERVRIGISAISAAATGSITAQRIHVGDIADLDAAATFDATAVRVFSLTNNLELYWDVHFPVENTYRPSWSRFYPTYPAVRSTASIRNVTLDGG